MKRLFLIPVLGLISAGCKTPPPPIVTRADFDKLEKGMTYQQVEDIIGTKCTMHTTPDLSSMGIKADSYVWKNPDGTGVVCFFYNDRLSSKDGSVNLQNSK